MPIQLRPWQTAATEKAIAWLVGTRSDRHFLINAAPGAGKTLCAIAVAEKLFELGEIDRVVVIAPRREVVGKWASDFTHATGRPMLRVTGRSSDDTTIGIDVCATWQAIEGLESHFRAICESHRTLVICDEHHHAAAEAAWGTSAGTAFKDARFVLMLTGTPLRSDGARSIWLDQGVGGGIAHPEEGTFTLTYGEAVDLEYCRPVTFARHEGRFTVDLDDGQTAEVTGATSAELPSDLKRIPGLQTALEFYRLACQPQYEPGTTAEPSLDGYHASMLEAAIVKLDELRLRMPRAGGLVIAPTIGMADFFARLITKLEGEKPIVVHTETPGADERIAAFRNSDHKWLVSVAMVSEGVDIPRLRVMVYLPSARTELAFRQAVGRVVRNSSEEGDDTRAYVVMPRLKEFEEYARRIEEEIPAHRAESGPARLRRCPICRRENPVGAATCSGCGHAFPSAPERTRPCRNCHRPMPVGRRSCPHCGQNQQANIVISLKEAMRDGVIVRGMEIAEPEARDGEDLAGPLRDLVIKSGDLKLIRLVRLLPDESMGRLRALLENA